MPDMQREKTDELHFIRIDYPRYQQNHVFKVIPFNIYSKLEQLIHLFRFFMFLISHLAWTRKVEKSITMNKLSTFEDIEEGHKERAQTLP